jgi:mannose-binding lectin
MNATGESEGAIMHKCFQVGVLVATLTIGAKVSAQQILFAKVTSAPATSSNQFVDIPGLGFQVPPVAATRNKALIILDVPEPFATGNDFPGIIFAIRVNGTRVAEGGFTYSTKVPESTGRMPTTLVVAIPLTSQPQFVQAQWESVRGSTNRIDSFASLSAVIGN